MTLGQSKIAILRELCCPQCFTSHWGMLRYIELHRQKYTTICIQIYLHIYIYTYTCIYDIYVCVCKYILHVTYTQISFFYVFLLASWPEIKLEACWWVMFVKYQITVKYRLLFIIDFVNWRYHPYVGGHYQMSGIIWIARWQLPDYYVPIYIYIHSTHLGCPPPSHPQCPEGDTFWFDQISTDAFTS